MSTARTRRLLRLYPRAWRDRYGDELVALVEDTFGEAKLPVRTSLGVARAGIYERYFELSSRDLGRGPAERVRAGSLLVLWAWTPFVLGGAVFAKFSEHWSVVTPRGDRWLPAGAYFSVVGAAGAGAAVVAIAAMAVFPAFARFLRDGGWADVRVPIRRAVAVAVTSAAALGGLVAWSHHLGPHQRNGGSPAYDVAGLVVVALIAATVVTCTAAATCAARKVILSPRVLRLNGMLALGLAAAIVVVISGTVVWWIAIAVDSPAFLSGGPLSVNGSPTPPILLAAGLLMSGGLVVAASGAGGVVRSIRATREAVAVTVAEPPAGA